MEFKAGQLIRILSKVDLESPVRVKPRSSIYSESEIDEVNIHFDPKSDSKPAVYLNISLHDSTHDSF